MPYANIAEVNACLTDCIAYCKKHVDREYCAQYLPLLEETKSDLKEAWATTDEYYNQWRNETAQDKVAWKKLSKVLREVQRRLERIDAIGYPDRRVMYWDEPILQEAVVEMLTYLRERTGDIDFAADYISRFEQLLDSAHSEHGESADALRNYQRFFRTRRDALSNAYHVIGEFRDSMRRRVGKDDAEYQEIRWAWSVSPDQSVL